MKNKINLKKSVNIRGQFGELIANNYMLKYGFTCNYEEALIKLKNKEHKDYLKQYGSSIDGFLFKEMIWNEESEHNKGITNFELDKIHMVYEVKTKWETSKTRLNITEASLNSYLEAIKLGIPTKLIIITFCGNFDIKITEKDFEKKYFKIYEKGKEQPYVYVEYGTKYGITFCKSCGQNISHLIK